MKKTFAALCVLVCGALPAAAQDIPAPSQIVADNDKNGDGGIDRMEWAASPAPIPFPEEYDANKDGKIDVAELEAMFAALFGGGAAPPAPPPPAPAAQPAPG